MGVFLLVGGIKEVVDLEILGGSVSVKDFMYISLGGMFGVSIVFLLNRKKKKKEESVNIVF